MVQPMVNIGGPQTNAQFKSFEKLLKRDKHSKMRAADKDDARRREGAVHLTLPAEKAERETTQDNDMLKMLRLDSLANPDAPHRLRLKTDKHMISFEDIKASTFTQAKMKMRSSKEERERLLGPLNAKNLRK